jgi:ribosomal protein S27AE
MTDDILRKLEQKVNRRSFLRGSGLAAAALVGAAAFPRLAGAQDQQGSQKKDDNDSGGDKPGRDDNPAQEPDEFKITKKDQNGRDYRVCPQCGYNMYKQDRTWTCENCGYSYTE